MKEEEVMHLLSHYRHDLLNDIQLIHGYASMGNLDKIKEKVKNVIDHFNQERLLTNLNCPHFMIWVLTFHTKYNQFKLTYQVEMGMSSLTSSDLSIYTTSEEMMDLLHKHISKDRIYNGELLIGEEEGMPFLTYTFQGPIYKIMDLKAHLLKISFIKEVDLNEESCKITIAL
ncbi:stage 0 sporulation protein B (sporulation initiation phosphotransferase) [Salirhabdus euzebyi]|uniref:Stage 0 sporulation protein B (Sporulation initiation phosphotransferase) n=1 Tax=Salirhabdus euzebyi TaxID=394506 RepID=A0A841PSZ6_9BACI|nr:Spo0B domain-containing protein [Salirhabdus euzebyi]MBB6451910.1 stage 0 sporulation protein B (sporulation initiation phosphotransferase) [Salirhabdus euzebyi]